MKAVKADRNLRKNVMNSNSTSPAISVIMPTYNTEVSFLRTSVDSILSQTFRDFEFIIIDDGSTNGSDQYLKSIDDDRVKIIWNSENLGITKSLNIGLKVAKGKYVARMDADDVSLPTRFEKQFIFLEAHPNVIILGSYEEYFGDFSRIFGDDIKSQSLYRIRLLFGNPGPDHPTFMMRRETIARRHVTYDESLKYSQDYGLLVESSQYGEIAIIPEILVKKRAHSRRISIEHRATQKDCDKLIERRLLERLGLFVTDEELVFHYQLRNEFLGKKNIYKSFRWFLKLIVANYSKKQYNRMEFSYICIKYFITGNFNGVSSLLYKAFMK